MRACMFNKIISEAAADWKLTRRRLGSSRLRSGRVRPGEVLLTYFSGSRPQPGVGVFMLGGSRLLIFSLLLLVGVVAPAYADDSRAENSVASGRPPGPPKAKVVPVEETVHGQTIVDRYRYLEDPNSPTPSSTSSRSWPTRASSSTRSPDATGSMRAFLSCWRSAPSELR